MKKTKVLMILLCAGLLLFVLFYKPLYKIGTGSFDLEDEHYQSYIRDYPELAERLDWPVQGVKISDTENRRTMVLEAEKLWIEIYGEDTVEERPYRVLYDEKYGAFMIHGTLPLFYGGGTAYMLIEDGTGEIIAI